MQRAEEVCFEALRLTPRGMRFEYGIDGRPFVCHSSYPVEDIMLSREEQYLIGVNIGLANLIDLMTICLPKRVRIEAAQLPSSGIEFWRDTYLGVALERLYCEGIDIQSLDADWICTTRQSVVEPIVRNPSSRLLLAMSGGKESLTALKIYEQCDCALLFYQYADKSWHYIKRVYDNLRQRFPSHKVRSDITYVNPLAKAYGCRDFSMNVICQVIFSGMLFSDRYRYIMVGNDYSSNFPNAIYQGCTVNHQFDKTLDYACRINRYIRDYVHRQFEYFSPFFGVYEYRIAQMFCADQTYLNIWTSCNNSSCKANFCGKCPKCAFIYIVMLPFMDPNGLQRHFQCDMLQNLAVCKPLMTLAGDKPLDCVGEKQEAQLAMYHSYLQGKGLGTPAMEYFLADILPYVELELDSIEREMNTEHTGFRYIPLPFQGPIRQVFDG